jgi:hypothetical protein
MEEMGVAITTTKEDVSSPFPCGTGFNTAWGLYLMGQHRFIISKGGWLYEQQAFFRRKSCLLPSSLKNSPNIARDTEQFQSFIW